MPKFKVTVVGKDKKENAVVIDSDGPTNAIVAHPAIGASFFPVHMHHRKDMYAYALTQGVSIKVEDAKEEVKK